MSQELAGLLRAMNSYCSNKIEGEHTRPLELQQALAQDVSSNAEKARLHRLAVAHMAREQWFYQQPVSITGAYAPPFSSHIHPPLL